MSGVIDENGVQWEHCNICGNMVKLEDLGFIPTWKTHSHGVDVCVKCVDKLIKERKIAFNKVVPAKTWKVYEVK